MKVRKEFEPLDLTELYRQRSVIIQEMRTTRETEKRDKMRSDCYALDRIIEREETLRKLSGRE